MGWPGASDKIYRSEYVAALFPAKHNVIAFDFASCLEIHNRNADQRYKGDK